MLSNISKTNKFPEKYLTHLHQLKTTLSKHLDELEFYGIVTNKKNLIDKIWSVGPRKCGTNILLNLTDYEHPKFWNINKGDNEISSLSESFDIRKDFNSSFVNGFQLATVAGPLCEEPMQGVCFVILKWEINTEDELNSKVFGPFSGKFLLIIVIVYNLIFIYKFS